MYASTFFGNMDVDSVTVAPYMGQDSVTPFLTYEGKWVTLLALTSNKGAFDFQFMRDAETGERLFEKVLKASLNWGNDENMMYVVGATKAEMLSDIRTIIPDHFLLVPGVGAQGGSLEEVCKYGLNSSCGLLVNSSRQIIYASSEADYAEAARKEALSVQTEMEFILKQAELIS
jgi:orotidine-5'-phosphate decarboxylase